MRQLQSRLCWIILFSGFIAIPGVSRCEDYDIFDLGPDLTENGSGYIWSGVNDAGEVVGRFGDGSTEYPVVWKAEEITRVTQTESSQASFIAEDGTVAGHITTANPGSVSNPQTRAAALWHRGTNGGYSEFTFPGLAGLFGTARALSNNGIIAGDRYLAGSPGAEYEIFVARPPLYIPATVFNEREFFSNTGIATTYPTRVLVNNEGSVAVSYAQSSPDQTFLFKAGVFSSINDLFPLALNDAGDILGTMQSPGAEESDKVPVILNKDGTRTLLAPPNGFDATSTTALAMSVERVVIGAANNESGVVPLVWRNGQPTNANTLIPSDSDWSLILPMKISPAASSMIGLGVLNGVTRWFLLKEKEICSASSISLRAGTLAAASCDLGVTWEMPGNESQQGAQWATGDGVIPPAKVNPKTYTVVLLATNGKKKLVTCPADRFYKWTMTPAFKLPAGRKQKRIIIGDSCREPIQVEDEGKYLVTVEERRKSDKALLRSAKKKEVIVQDWLIVAMGDSNGSGQGTAQDRIPYEFPQCDRNHHSYQAQVAEMLEAADDKTSVTLIHTSCSGAQTVHITDRPYLGQNADLKNKLPNQVSQVMRRLTATKKIPKEVDAVILSIGVNDILFGGVLGQCIPAANTPLSGYTECREMMVETRTNGNGEGELSASSGPRSKNIDTAIRERVALLPKLFKSVTKGINTLGVRPSSIFHTTYPDFTHDQTGAICDEKSVGLRSTDWLWLGAMRQLLTEEILKNQQAGRGKKAWAAAPDFKGLFNKHGYCAESQSWIQGLIVSIVHQFTKNGGFHSVRAGHVAMANSLFPVLCKELYGNDTCTGTPRTSKLCSVTKSGSISCK